MYPSVLHAPPDDTAAAPEPSARPRRSSWTPRRSPPSAARLTRPGGFTRSCSYSARRTGDPATGGITGQRPGARRAGRGELGSTTAPRRHGPAHSGPTPLVAHSEAFAWTTPTRPNSWRIAVTGSGGSAGRQRGARRRSRPAHRAAHRGPSAGRRSSGTTVPPPRRGSTGRRRPGRARWSGIPSAPTSRSASSVPPSSSVTRTPLEVWWTALRLMANRRSMLPES